MKLMRAKFAFSKEDENDLDHITDLLAILDASSLDYTAFFRLLSHYKGNKTELLAFCKDQTTISQWLDDYNKRLEKENSGR